MANTHALSIHFISKEDLQSEKKKNIMRVRRDEPFSTTLKK